MSNKYSGNSTQESGDGFDTKSPIQMVKRSRDGNYQKSRDENKTNKPSLVIKKRQESDQ